MLSTAALLLSLTIYHEAGNQSHQCQRYVADTVVNRMAIKKLSAERVIKERGQYQWLHHVKGRSLVQDYQHIQIKGKPADKVELQHATLLANQVLSSGYVPAYKGVHFQSKHEPIPRWYKGHFRCGDLVFERGLTKP